MEAVIRQSAEQSAIAEQIRRCVEGDAGAWRDLVSTYYRLIYYLCYNFTRSASDAEDLTQDVFLKLFCNLSRFDGAKGSFQNWIQNVTRNHLVDNFRATQLIRASDSLDAGLEGEEESCARAYRLADERPSPEQSFASLEVKTRIYTALGQLSPYSRDAVILCDLEDREYREAAQILGIPEGTVKSRLSRGRAELGRILSSDNESSTDMVVERRQRVVARRDVVKARPRVRRSGALQASLA